MCLRLCKEEGSSPVSLQSLRGGIWACMRCPCLCLCWVLEWVYVSQLPYVWYYVGVKNSFQHAREVAVHLALWYVVLSAISMMFVNIRLAVCMLVGMVV